MKIKKIYKFIIDYINDYITSNNAIIRAQLLGVDFIQYNIQDEYLLSKGFHSFRIIHCQSINKYRYMYIYITSDYYSDVNKNEEMIDYKCGFVFVGYGVLQDNLNLSLTPFLSCLYNKEYFFSNKTVYFETMDDYLHFPKLVNCHVVVGYCNGYYFHYWKNFDDKILSLKLNFLCIDRYSVNELNELYETLGNMYQREQKIEIDIIKVIIQDSDDIFTKLHSHLSFLGLGLNSLKCKNMELIINSKNIKNTSYQLELLNNEILKWYHDVKVLDLRECLNLSQI